MTGIPALAERTDLADRRLSVELKRIEPQYRKTEDKFWSDWENSKPRVLGAFLTALSSALAKLQHQIVGFVNFSVD